MTTTEVAVPHSRVRRRLIDLTKPGALLRFVLTVAVVGFLLYYVGPTDIGTTLLKVVVAVAISIGLIVGLNLMFNLVYDGWTVFMTVAGVAIGALIFLVLDGNRILRDVEPRPWLWALIGGASAGAVMFLLSAPRQQLARMPLAVAGFGGLGVLLAVAVDDNYHPGLDWAKLLVCIGIGLAIGGGLSMLGRRRGVDALRTGALIGGATGWLIGGWGGAELGDGNFGEALVASVIPLAAVGYRVGLGGQPSTTTRRELETRSRSWIFVTPALLFIAAGLLLPLVRTVVLSFRDRSSDELVGLQNYRDVLTGNRQVVAEEFVDVENWASNLFGSRLWWIGVAIVGVGIVIGVIGGRARRQAFAAEPGTMGPVLIGLFLAACAVFATIRGTLMNNLWWVMVVTALATTFGLAVAVLADRARGENIAKSLIFLPMAISFVGAGIIWRFVYVPRNVNQPQTGLLNAIWVGLGELSNSDWQKWVVTILAIALIVGLFALALTGYRDGNGSRVGFCVGMAFVLAVLLILLLGPGLGGFEETRRGVRPAIIDFVRETPFNNMWLMVILIWIQTGFAMVIFSSAIKAVPTELTEAARIDGAREAQIFWKVTLPQIGPTVGVVTTTLIVTVMKVFDIVKVTTGGTAGTQVIANQMQDAVENRNAGVAATLATLLFVGVLPVMFYNIRRMQKAKV